MVVVGVRRDDAPEAFSSVPGAGHVLINVRRHHGGGWNEAAAVPQGPGLGNGWAQAFGGLRFMETLLRAKRE